MVVKDVLSEDEIHEVVESFWSNSGMDRNDPSTWAEYYDAQRFGRFGIIGRDSSLDPTLLNLRQNPKVYKGFSAVLNADKLWVDHDRLGVMRPTKNIVFP